MAFTRFRTFSLPNLEWSPCYSITISCQYSEHIGTLCFDFDLQFYACPSHTNSCDRTLCFGSREQYDIALMLVKCFDIPYKSVSPEGRVVQVRKTVYLCDQTVVTLTG